VDLGEYWEGATGAPIPLGGIVIKRSLPSAVRQAMNRVMRRSVEYALANPDASGAFVRAHAQEMNDEVMRQHIELYVNAYSVDLGPEGRRAVEVLFERAASVGIAAEPRVSPFRGVRWWGGGDGGAPGGRGGGGGGFVCVPGGGGGARRGGGGGVVLWVWGVPGGGGGRRAPPPPPTPPPPPSPRPSRVRGCPAGQDAVNLRDALGE
jgi:hypothetical protein